MVDVKQSLSEFSAKFNADLPEYLPVPNGVEKRVVEAMSYSLMNGGKRLRPFLLCQCAALFDVDYKTCPGGCVFGNAAYLFSDTR